MIRNLKPEDKIIESALQTIEESTISGIRMHLIAKKANMAQSNLHYYFKTKDDLLIALQKKVLDQCHIIRKNFSAKAKNTLEDQIDVFINQKKNFILNSPAYDYAEMDFWTLARVNEKIKEGFEFSFNSWRNEIGEVLDTYAPSIPKKEREYLPYIIVSLLEGATIQYVNSENKFNVDEYFSLCKKIILDIINSKL